MKKLYPAVLSVCCANAFSAFPEIPFPAGTCSGLIPGDNSSLIDRIRQDSEPLRGIASSAIAFDFDNLTVSGQFIFFIEPDTEDEVYPKWSWSQEGSPIDLSIERDSTFPTSFLATFEIDNLKGLDYDFVNMQPTGNVHDTETVTLRLLPVNNGATFIIQGNGFQGVCQAH